MTVSQSRRRFTWLPALIITITVTALLAGYIILQQVQTRLMAGAGESLALAASDIAGKLEMLLAERYGDIQMMANSRTFQGQDRAEMTQYLHWMQEAYPVYERLAVTDATGRIIAATDPAGVGKDSSDRDWFRAVRDRRGVHVRDAQFDPDSDGTLAVNFTAAIKGDRGEFLGAVTSRVLLAVLEDVFAQTATALQAQHGTTARIEYQFLLQDGMLVSDSLLREEGTVNLKQLGLPSAWLFDSAPPGYVEEQHHRRHVLVITGYAQTKGDTAGANLRWGILVRMEKEDILAPIRRTLWFLGGGLCLVFIPMIGVLFWSTRRLAQEWELGHRRSAALAGLVESSRQLSCEPDLEPLLMKLVETGRNLAGARYAALGVFDKAGTKLDRFLISGMDEQTRQAIGPLPAGKGLLGHLTKEEGVLRLKDLALHPASVGFPPHHPAMHSFLGVSIQANGRLFGRLYLTEKEGSQKDSEGFTDLDEQVIEALAAEAGVAIHNATLMQAARVAEAKYRLLLESPAEGIYGLDLEGRCTFINASGAAMLGYRPEEMVGQDMHALVHHSYPDGSPYPVEQGPLAEAFRTGRECRIDHESLWRRNGSPFPAEISSCPIIENDTITGAVITFTDITERKRTEAELATARDTALNAVRLKSEFLATMSHEIRTPMNGVIGMTGLLLDTDLTAEQREYAEAVRRSGEALLEIISDILDVSKIEAGKLTLEIIPFDLRTLIEDVAVLMAERAHAKGLELACLIHADVPVALRGDPGRLRQVLTNLVGNAVKFTERGEVLISATVDDETDHDAVIRLTVTDTGIGLTEEQRGRLFQPFTQADGSTTRKYGGTGLGLAICKQLAERMDGKTGVWSTPGHGSTFWFTAQLGKAPAPTTILSLPHDLRGRRILIVDDNATSRTMLQHQTTAWAMQCTSAEDAPSAIEMLRAAALQGKPYDLAIVDLIMPGMGGVRLSAAIKADPLIAATRLILLTSFGQRGHAAEAQQAGCAAYLTKPVRQAQLFECLTTVLEGASPSPPPLITRHTLAERQHQARGRILVVEDNTTNQMVAVRMLEKLGYRADVAADGKEAVTAVSQVPYDLVLMDCQMPVMDGYEATAKIREMECRGDAVHRPDAVHRLEERASHRLAPTKHIPIIAMTANAMSSDRERCLAAGMDDFLSKPVTKEALDATIQRWLPPVPADAPVGAAPCGRPTEGNHEGLPLPNHAPDPSSPALDPATLTELREVGGEDDPQFLARLLERFLLDAPAHLTALREGLSKGNVPSLMRAAHSLKGSCSSVGALDMAELCARVEQTGRAGAGQETASLLAQATEEFARVQAAAQRIIRETSRRCQTPFSQGA